MDRELAGSVVRKRRIKSLTWVGSFLAVLFLGVYTLRSASHSTLERARLLTSVAEIGSIEATVNASGRVVPEFEQVLTSPVTTTIETVHIQSGDSVHAGESILQLNTEELKLAHDKISDELEIQKSMKEQEALESQRQRSDLAAAYDIKVLQEKSATSKYELVQHLFDIGGITKAELEVAKLDLSIAKREVQQLADQVQNQDAHTDVSQRGLDLQINVQRSRMSEIERQLDHAATRAGRDGIVTWVNDNIGAPVNPGDVVARVADLSSFKVEGTISDVHAGKLGLGGTVNVRIGDTELRGHIASVRPAIQNGIVTFVVELNDKSNTVLRPNLRTDVYVVTSTVDSVMRVQNGPFYDGAHDQKVFVIKGNAAVGKTVNIGVSNFEWVEIQGDVKPGDEVIVSDMKKYQHMDEIAVR